MAIFHTPPIHTPTKRRPREKSLKISLSLGLKILKLGKEISSAPPFKALFVVGPTIKKLQSCSKFSISIEIYNLARKCQSRRLQFPIKNRAAVGGSLENSILARNFQSRSKSRFFSIFGPSGFVVGGVLKVKIDFGEFPKFNLVQRICNFYAETLFLRSFAALRLRSFAHIYALLHTFTLFCAHLRVSASDRV